MYSATILTCIVDKGPNPLALKTNVFCSVRKIHFHTQLCLCFDYCFETIASKYKLNKMLKMLKCMQNSWKAVTFQENGPLHSQFLKWNNPFCTLMSDTLHLYWTECTSNYDWFLEGRCHIWQGSQLTLHIFPGMWCTLFGSQVTFTELDVCEFVSLKLFLRKQVTHSGKSVQFPCISCSVMATFAGYWQTGFTFITQDFKN